MHQPRHHKLPRRSSRLSDLAVPVVAFVLITAGVVAMASVSRQAEASRIRVATQVTAEQLRQRLEAWIDARQGMVTLVGDRWDSVYRDNPNAYRAEASRLLHFYPGLQALNWVDGDRIIRIIVPEAGNEPALNKNLRNHPSKHVWEALERAERTKKPTRTPVLALLQGGQGFATYYAVCTARACPAGFINGVFRIDRLVDTCLAESHLRSNFVLDLFDAQGSSVYRQRGERSVGASAVAARVEVRVVDRSWTLQLAPSQTYLAASYSALPTVVVGVGGALAAAIAWLLWLLIGRHRAVLTSEHRYRSLFAAAGDGILLVRDGRFADCNETACRLFGQTRDELLGQAPWHVSPAFQPDGRESESAATAFLASAKADRPVSFEWVHQRKDGTPFEAEVSLTDLALLGEGHLLAIVRDISPRKRFAREQLELRDQRMKAQKLESLGILAGGIAHDFNNIVQVIRGNAELAMSRLSEPAEASRLLVEVDKAAARAAELCRQLLAYSGRGRFEVTALDFGELVQDMATMLEVAAPKKVRLVIEPAVGVPWVEADATQMRQIVMNLITNAAESIGAQPGEVRVAVDVVAVAAPIVASAFQAPPPSPGSYVRLRVTDTGAGMDQATLARLWEPFFTTKFTGRGLGLSALLGIVRAHRGGVIVTSEVGGGSCFEVLLPAIARGAHQVAVASAGLEHSVSSTGLVLLADDEPSVALVGRQVLEALGYDVVVAADGREALAVFHLHMAHLTHAIVDLTMPYLGGDEVYREIRRHRPLLPVVICSGYDESDTAASRSGDPASAFLQKPYLISDLRAALQKASYGAQARDIAG